MIDEALRKLSEKLNSDEKNIVIVHTGISAGENTPPWTSFNFYIRFI